METMRGVCAGSSAQRRGERANVMETESSDLLQLTDLYFLA